MLLQITSALFSTIVFHAHLRGHTDIVALSLLVTVFSLWFHSTRHPTILKFDMFFAHLYFLYTAAWLVHYRSWVLVLNACILATYAALCRTTDPTKKLCVHFIMHCQVMAGSHLFLHHLGKHRWSVPEST